jgi:hypothetical protein
VVLLWSSIMLAGREVNSWRRERRTRLGLAGGLVSGAGEALLGLVEGGLGGVRGLEGLAVVAVRACTTYELLLSLGVEVLASGLRHVDVCGSGCWFGLVGFGLVGFGLVGFGLVGFECRVMQ